MSSYHGNPSGTHMNLLFFTPSCKTKLRPQTYLKLLQTSEPCMQPL